MDAYDLMNKIEEEILEELQSIMQPSIHDGISKTAVSQAERGAAGVDIHLYRAGQQRDFAVLDIRRNERSSAGCSGLY